MTRFPRLLLTAVLTLAALLLAGPGLTAAAHAGTAVPGKSWVRVAHFVPGMGAASIELTPLGDTAEPAMTASGASYGQVTAYDRLAPGTYTATVRKDGAAAAEPLLSRSVTLVAGEARTVAVVGTADQPRLVLLRDDLTPPAAGSARVRLLSASDAAQAVTVKAVDGPTLAEDTVLGETTGYTTVPDGAWDLQLTSTGGGSTDRTVRLASGSVYTVVALDAGSGVTLDVVTDAAGAMATPQGGADTGLGGMAGTTAADRSDDRVGTLAALAAVGALLAGLLAGAGLTARRRAVRRTVRGSVA